jgi:hypothetical protein
LIGRGSAHRRREPIVFTGNCDERKWKSRTTNPSPPDQVALIYNQNSYGVLDGFLQELRRFHTRPLRRLPISPPMKNAVRRRGFGSGIRAATTN